jgi:L-seryl-tRNA(Ser) seleniumtransferase
MNKNQVLRQIPSVNELIATDSAQSIGLKAGQKHLAELARIAIEELREELLSTQETLETSREELIERACEILKAINLREISTGVRGVINATGVIIHTNLGRAPLSTKALEKIRDVSRYCTLEYSLESGSRCKRAARSEYLIRELTGAEDALIVNNCAAAALLVLSTLAQGGETILSRGEMVEIGGDFRVPEIMAQSGTRLVEVGTTNRTRLSDYESHIHQNTRLLMRVHTSNYRIIGFTSVPTLKELSELARRTGLILYEDAGSGALVDLTSFGLEDEPVISRSIKDCNL